MTHHGAGPAPDLLGTEMLVVALLAVGWGYLAAAHRRGRPRHDGAGLLESDGSPARAAPPGAAWPRRRPVCWTLGVAAAVAGTVGPALLGHDLRGHVAGHLLLGMTAPVLLVTAAPVTLALRTLPRSHGRALGRLLRSRAATVVTHPAVAAVLDTGGLWLVQRTDLLTAVPAPLLDAHMLSAGYLFAFSLVGTDPAPHRPALAVRAGVVVAAAAAHDVLARLVYAAPPSGVPAGQAEAAGLLLYYGGTPVHVVLLVLLGREWAAGQRRRRVRPASPRVAAGTGQA
jgi:putative membrane protein